MSSSKRPRRSRMSPPPPLSPDVQLSPCPTPPSSTPAKRRIDAEMSKMVHDFVRYVLIADQQKHAIRKADIVKNAMKGKSKMFNLVKIGANKTLKEVFGFKLTQIRDKKDNYILVNLIPDANEPEFDETQLHQRGLLFFVLTVIYMHDGVTSESELYKTLGLMNVNVESNKPHSLFGDVKKYLTNELVKQMYLEYHPITGSDPIKYEFSWGFRAIREVNKEKMLNFVCEIYENKPEDWISQYRVIELAKQAPEDESDDDNMGNTEDWIYKFGAIALSADDSESEVSDSEDEV